MALVDDTCQGVGLGLRPPHLYQVLRERPAVPWLEVHICNYLAGGINRKLLQRIREHYPISFHGVSLNLGGTAPLDQDYLRALKTAITELAPGLVSEHACFTAHDGQYFHDLLPLPFTEASVEHMVSRVNQVQDCVGRTIAIENLSRYSSYTDSTLSEAEFLTAVAKQSGCHLLLDLNNLYVNQQNLGESSQDFFATLPADIVSEIHLAGHSDIDGRLVDTHGAPVCDAVWQLFQDYSHQHPTIPTLIEWDSNLPDFEVLMAEKARAESYLPA